MSNLLVVQFAGYDRLIGIGRLIGSANHGNPYIGSVSDRPIITPHIGSSPISIWVPKIWVLEDEKKIFSFIFDDFLNWNKPNVLLNFEKSWINLEHRNFLSKSPSWYWCLSVSVSDRYRPIWKKSYRQFIGSADLKNGIYRCLSVSADMKKSLSVVPWYDMAQYLLVLCSLQLYLISTCCIWQHFTQKQLIARQGVSLF